MKKEQLELLEKIRKAEIEQTARWMDYWKDYSSINDWQFWVVLAMLVVPLIVLVIFIDRKRIFLIGFYGYSIHLITAVLDVYGVSKGLWIYPYKLLPGLPANISLDSSFVPVAYMLFYQYILNKGKNYYVWIVPLCLIFSFLIKPLLLGLGLFRFGGKENFLMLLWVYLGIAFIAKWLTDVFIYLQKTNKWSYQSK